MSQLLIFSKSSLSHITRIPRKLIILWKLFQHLSHFRTQLDRPSTIKRLGPYFIQALVRIYLPSNKCRSWNSCRVDSGSMDIAGFGRAGVEFRVGWSFDFRVVYAQPIPVPETKADGTRPDDWFDDDAKTDRFSPQFSKPLLWPLSCWMACLLEYFHSFFFMSFNASDEWTGLLLSEGGIYLDIGLVKLIAGENWLPVWLDPATLRELGCFELARL